MQYGKFPELLSEVSNDGRFNLSKEGLVDPWGEPIGYEYSERGDGFVVWSTGPDKKLGTADDVVKGAPESYVASWRAKHGLPVVENAIQKTVTAEEQARQWEESKREAEYAAQQVAEDRRRVRSGNRQVGTVAALILGFYVVLPRLLKKFKRGAVRRILISFAVGLGIMVVLWCAGLAYAICRWG